MEPTPEILAFEAFIAQQRPNVSQPYQLQDDRVCSGTAGRVSDQKLSDPDRKAIDRILGRIASSLRDILGHSNSDDEKLSVIQYAIDSITNDRPISISVIGSQGRGKSLLVNALLHRKTLRNTSLSGRGCTSCPIKYEHTPLFGDDQDLYSAQVQSKPFGKMKSLIGTFVDKWLRYHCSTIQGSDGQVTEGREELREDARAAERFFRWFCNADNDPTAESGLQELLSQAKPAKSEIVGYVVSKFFELKQRHGFDERGSKTLPAQSGREVASQLDPYITHENDRPDLWLIVDWVVVYTGSELLGRRISIFDLPGKLGSSTMHSSNKLRSSGLGDINQARTLSTNWVRRTADYEIIVDVSDRILDDIAVELQLKQSIKTRGAKRTILVLTKIDVCSTTLIP